MRAIIVFLISSAHWLVWESVGEMVENLSVLKRRPEIGHLYLVVLTKQKDNITGSFSKVLRTPAKERVLRATWTLKNLSVLGFGGAFCFSFWCRSSSCWLSVSTEVCQNLIQRLNFCHRSCPEISFQHWHFFLQSCCQYFLVTNLLCFLPFYGAIFKLYCVFFIVSFLLQARSPVLT